MIKKVGSKWYLYSSNGNKILGKHNSKEKAIKQEQAINIRKHKLDKLKVK